MPDRSIMTPEVNQPGPSDYFGVLRRHKGTIVLITLAAVVLALAFSFSQAKVYEATAEVLLRERATDSVFDSGSAQQVDPARVLETEIRVITGPDVRAAAEAKLGGKAPKITSAARPDSDVIEISARHADPGRAAAVANAYATAYVEMRRKEAVDDVLAATGQIQDKINDLQGRIDKSTGPARDSLLQAQAVFRQKLDELQVDAALKSGGVRLVAPATPPASPASPKPLRAGLLALAFGLVLGVGVAFLRDYLDDSVKSKEDLERSLPGLPVIGLIPSVPGWKATEAPRVVSLTDPQSPAPEAYRTLRTAIQFLDLDRPVRTIQVTSPGIREGKTTTVANLGVAMARAGHRVAIVCCDLRRPRIHEFFGLGNDIGFTSVMIGRVPLSGALCPVPGQPRLSLLASGPLPPNPSELLASKRAAEVLSTLRDEADIVILDCPPVLPVTDALVVSGRADATLLLCRASLSTRKSVTRAVELLRQVDAPLVGVVFNGVAADAAYRDAYEYYRPAEAAAHPPTAPPTAPPVPRQPSR